MVLGRRCQAKKQPAVVLTAPAPSGMNCGYARVPRTATMAFKPGESRDVVRSSVGAHVLSGTIVTVSDNWKVRWTDSADKSARSVEDMWASNPLTSEAAARDQFMSMKNVATGLGYRCIQLMNGDTTVDQWEAESGTSTD